MKIHQLSVDEAVASLNSTPSGLSSHEAARRLREYGRNEVEEVTREPALLRLLKEFTHFFALILWVAAGLAFLAEWSAPGQGMAKIGYAIVGVILVSGVFSFWQEHRVEQTLAALRKLLPQRVDVLRDGKARTLPRSGWSREISSFSNWATMSRRIAA